MPGNMATFIPLGSAIAVVPPSHRQAAVLVGAVALRFVIEVTQLRVTPLAARMREREGGQQPEGTVHRTRRRRRCLQARADDQAD